MMNSNDYNEEQLNERKEQVEKEFDKVLEQNGDISSFLYIPHNFLSERIKNCLDEFLLIKAYDAIEKNLLTEDSFVVYSDSLLTVNLIQKDQQLDILERLISYFVKKEEYEKCSKIRSLMLKIR